MLQVIFLNGHNVVTSKSYLCYYVQSS